jgi:flagellar protein FlaG
MTSINTDKNQVIRQTDPMPVRAEVKLPQKEVKADTPETPRVVVIDHAEMEAKLQKIISQFNDLIKDGGRGLEFSVDSALGRPVLVVKNQETGEVIRQLPGEEVVRIAHSIEKLKGILLNKTT